MHLAITELASRDMETNHVAIDRLRETTHDVVLFTQMELDHVQQCVGCFEEWAVLIENIQTDLFE
jgi:hypothetical protein